jgi:hypothetical protein
MSSKKVRVEERRKGVQEVREGRGWVGVEGE